jgi:Tol biopolymer transport system component
LGSDKRVALGYRLTVTSRTYATRCIGLAIAIVLYAPVGARAQEPTFQIAFQTDRPKAGDPNRDSDIWLVDSNGENERPLTQTPTPEASPSWSPDGMTIVFACSPDPNWDLCTINLATGEVTQITKTAAHEFDARYMPDGKQIVLETYAKGRRNSDIAIVPASGGVPKRLTFTPDANDQDPAPDPNSTRIAFESGGNIVILETEGRRDVERVTRASRGDTDPSFSSRGEIAFASPNGRSYDIVVADRRQSLKRRTLGGQNDIEPAWTADGMEIFFARSQRPGSRRFRIFRIGANGRRPRAVTKGGTYADTEPAPQPVRGTPMRGRIFRLIAQAAPAALAGTGSPKGACRYTRHGGSSGDTLRGTSNPGDCLYGHGGNDSIYVKDGHGDHANCGDGRRDQAWLDRSDSRPGCEVQH